MLEHLHAQQTTLIFSENIQIYTLFSLIKRYTLSKLNPLIII